MCGRDGGVEILVDGKIKERILLYNKPKGKSALEAIKEEQVDIFKAIVRFLDHLSRHYKMCFTIVYASRNHK